MPQEQGQTQNQETDSLDEMDGLRTLLANANRQATLNNQRAAEAEKQIETLRSKFQVLEEDNKKLLTDDISALKAGYEERAKQTETSSLKTMFQMAFVAAGGDSKRAADVFKFCGDRLGFTDNYFPIYKDLSNELPVQTQLNTRLGKFLAKSKIDFKAATVCEMRWNISTSYGLDPSRRNTSYRISTKRRLKIWGMRGAMAGNITRRVR